MPARLAPVANRVTNETAFPNKSPRRPTCPADSDSDSDSEAAAAVWPRRRRPARATGRAIMIASVSGSQRVVTVTAAAVVSGHSDFK